MPSLDQFVGWGEETVWGTAVARTGFARAYAETKFNHVTPQTPHSFIGGRYAIAPLMQQQHAEAELVIPFTYTGCEILLSHMMGAKISTSAGPPYTHTLALDHNPYDRATAPFFGLTLEHHLDLPDAGPIESFIMHGARCSQWSTIFRVNEECKLTSSWAGKKIDQVVKSATPAYPDYEATTDNPILRFSDITATIATTTTSMYSLEINVNNNLRMDRGFLGSDYIEAPTPAGRAEITGTIETQWLSNVDYAKFVAGTPVAIVATATTGAGIVTTISLPVCYYSGETPGGKEGEDIDLTLPFTAYMDDGTLDALRITQENGVLAPV